MDEDDKDEEFIEDNLDEDFELNAIHCLLTEDIEDIKNVKKFRLAFDKDN